MNMFVTMYVTIITLLIRAIKSDSWFVLPLFSPRAFAQIRQMLRITTQNIVRYLQSMPERPLHT
jgi:hypothetical protein